MLLVAGATGNVGGEVVRNAVEVGEPVRALTRRAVDDEARPGGQATHGRLAPGLSGNVRKFAENHPK